MKMNQTTGTSLGDNAIAAVTTLANAYARVLIGSGIPFATKFRLPMRDLNKAWYAAHNRWKYDCHPPAFDWNLETGGDSDLGERLVAPFSGIVLSAVDWKGRTGRVIQLLGITPGGKLIVWGGWHLLDMFVSGGQIVSVGDEIGTIGNADGEYYAHLHEQICIVGRYGIPTPYTFVSDTRYHWCNCDEFYIEHGVDRELVERCVRWDG